MIFPLQSSNGTTVNTILKKGETVELNEGDVIGIVGGKNPPSVFIGNYNFVVYRLCKYSSDNLRTIEIEDDSPIELSDDDDNVLCLDDSDCEAVDPKEDDDVAGIVADLFNAEIKKELADLEDFEEQCKEMKREPSEQLSEDIDDYTFLYNTHQPLDDVANENNYEQNDSDSNDSDKTLYFPTDHEQDDDYVNVSPENDENTALSNVDKHVNGSPANRGKKTLPTVSSDITATDNKHSKVGDSDLKLKEIITKVNVNRKRGAEIIEAKPLMKKCKNKSEEAKSNVKSSSPTVAKEEKKEKLKNIAFATKTAVEDKPKTQIKAKVKFTPNNRGHFLTDVTQAPVLPKYIKQPKRKDVVNGERRPSISTVDSTPLELEMQISESMSFDKPQKVIISLNEVKSTSKFVDHNNSLNQSPIHEGGLEGEEDGHILNDIDSYLGQDKDLERENDEDVDMDAENVEEDDGENDDETLYQSIMKLPPENAKITIIETEPRLVFVESILKKTQSSNNQVKKSKRRVTFKESGFQFDPLHQIISILTSYDAEEFKTLDAFCNSIDTEVSSFADTYDDYEEYRG